MPDANPKQTELPVPSQPRADVERLRAALAFFGLHEDPRRRAREVERGRWEFEVSVVGMPPVRAAGRTRDECLREALRATTEALRAHAGDLRRRVELLSDNARDIDRFVEEARDG